PSRGFSTWIRLRGRLPSASASRILHCSWLWFPAFGPGSARRRRRWCGSSAASPNPTRCFIFTSRSGTNGFGKRCLSSGPDLDHSGRISGELEPPRLTVYKGLGSDAGRSVASRVCRADFGLPQTACKRLILKRKWWNWQTHHLEGVAPKGVGVQIPPSAPSYQISLRVPDRLLRSVKTGLGRGSPHQRALRRGIMLSLPCRRALFRCNRSIWCA